MTRLGISSDCEIIRYQAGRREATTVPVVRERQLTLFLNHVELVTLVCSPGGTEELGVGFLVSEGIIQKRADIRTWTCREEEGLLRLETSVPTPQIHSFLRRHMTSCCGKGRAGLYYINDVRQLQAIRTTAVFPAEQLLRFIRELENGSETFQTTGGTHGAALADDSGMRYMFEDIGRHNAVDKVLGKALLEEIPMESACLVLTGRVSSEILIKAVRSQVAFVVSRSAPTALAVELADEFGITLAGFARGDRMNIYSHAGRITG